MPSAIRKDLEKRAQEAILRSIVENYKQQKADWQKEPALRKAVLLHSFFSSTSAAIIAGTILLSGCLSVLLLPAMGLAASMILLAGLAAPALLGILAEVMFIVLSLKNEKLHSAAVAEMLRPQVEFDPETIQNPNLRTKFDKALEYWSLIDNTITKSPPGPVRERLIMTTREVTHWLQAVYNLAERVDKFYLNKVIEQDLRSVPLAIQNFERKLREEDSPEVRRQIERTIGDKKRQLQTLQNLENNMERANYQLDSTISALGTIYSQILLVGSKDEEGSRLSRLQEEVSEQVQRLEDLTEAMDEVYQGTM